MSGEHWVRRVEYRSRIHGFAGIAFNDLADEDERGAVRETEEGKRRWRIENRGWRLFQKSILNPPSSILAQTLPIDEVNELPAAFDAPDADAVAVVIQTRI